MIGGLYFGPQLLKGIRLEIGLYFGPQWFNARVLG